VFGSLSNAWHFIVMTVDSSKNVKLYDNGSQLGTTWTPSSFATPDGNFFGIGSDEGPYYPIASLIDEVGYWSKVLTAQDIIDLYQGGGGNSMVNSGGGGGGVISASFGYPSSSIPTPDFKNWVINVSGIATGTTYYVNIQYQNSSDFNFVDQIYQDYSSFVSASGTSLIWAFPKSQSLFRYQNNSGTSTNWTALLYISSSSAGTNVTSSQITFRISPFVTSTPSISNATIAGPFYYNPVQTVPTFDYVSLASSSEFLYWQCPPHADILDIGGGIQYGLCVTGRLFFEPDNTIRNNFQAHQSTIAH